MAVGVRTGGFYAGSDRLHDRVPPCSTTFHGPGPAPTQPGQGRPLPNQGSRDRLRRGPSVRPVRFADLPVVIRSVSVI